MGTTATLKSPADQPWRTITPLTRAPVPCAHENLLIHRRRCPRCGAVLPAKEFIMRFARRELAANAITKIIRGKDRQSALQRIHSRI